MVGEGRGGGRQEVADGVGTWVGVGATSGRVPSHAGFVAEEEEEEEEQSGRNVDRFW